MNLTKSALLAVLLSSIMVTTASAGGNHHKKDHHKMMMDKLELSESQRAQLKSYRAQNHDAMNNTHKRLKAVKKDIHQLMKGDSFNESQLRALLSQQANIKADLMIAKREQRNQMRAVLTAEQQQKLEKLKSAKKHKKHHKKMHKHERDDA